MVDWGKKGIEGKAASLINLMRSRGLDMPIVILVRRKRFEDIPVEVLDYIDGYVFLAEETPEFIARNLVSRLKQYAETLKTPFFGALVDYAEEGNQLWTCPGHNGGIFYSRSPIGRIFMEHLGEAIFRDDLDNSVLELGDLLTHEGPALKAQKEAAAIFGAEKTYFVLNGTSSSNKIVLTSLVAEGDLVLFDRNNHKAAHHGALLMARRHPGLPLDRPQRLRPDRPDPSRGVRRDGDPRAHPHQPAGQGPGGLDSASGRSASRSSSNAPTTARSTTPQRSSSASAICATTSCSTRPGRAS